MLLAFDIGNTHIKTGVFNSETLEDVKRFDHSIPTEKILHTMIEGGINNIVVSSVVPEKTKSIQSACRNMLKINPFIVRHDNVQGLKLNVYRPETVGADRICNIVAGNSMFNPPMIIVDFGTGTTYDVIDNGGEFIGGVIAPGIDISAKYLYQKAALLRDTAFQFPDFAIGKTTEKNLQSGIMFGALDSVEGMIVRIKTELQTESPIIILTGGFSEILSSRLSFEHKLVPDLTLKGMNVIFRMKKGL